MLLELFDVLSDVPDSVIDSISGDEILLFFILCLFLGAFFNGGTNFLGFLRSIANVVNSCY